MIRPGRRTLAFSAHAADFCTRAGGSLMRLAQDGQVKVIDLTYGERCEAPALWARQDKPSIDEIKDIRRQEMESAAAILGVEIECFDFGDCPLLLGPERRLLIMDAIRAFQPDLVLTHWIDDHLHPDHVETSQAVLWACCYCQVPGVETAHSPCSLKPELVCYEAQLGSSPQTKFLPEFFVDVTAVFDHKMEAMKCFAAQYDPSEGYEVLGRYRALEANLVANMAGCRYAEGFCRIGADAVY
jgi:4-oxalomesaconate hydratase